MRPQKKEPDCHTKAIIEALGRFKETGSGRNIFITSRHEIEGHLNNARNFLQGEFPVISSRHMAQITLGDGQSGKGLGFMIRYMHPDQLRHGPDALKGFNGRVTVLDDALMMHALPLGIIREIEEVIAANNSRY